MGNRGSGCLAAFVTVVLVVIGLAGLAVAGVGVEFHRRTAPPDVAAVGRSAAVDAADAPAVPLLDDRMTTITALAVDMTPVTTSVRDVCGSRRQGLGYGPVTCTRTVSRYFAFGGTVPPRRSAWDAALRAAGWTSTAPSPPSDDWRTPLTYTDHAGVTLDVGWEQRPQPPTMWDRNDPGEVTYYRTDQPVDVDTTAATVYRTEPYMAVTVLQTAYYDDSIGPTSGPDTGHYHPCYSGSGDCVGG
jgi:hypothetical protein